MSTLPRELERVILRCLKKDPEARIQHMDDVKLALEDVLEEIDAPAVATRAPKRNWRAWLIRPSALQQLQSHWELAGGGHSKETNHVPTPDVSTRRYPRREICSGGSIVYAADVMRSEHAVLAQLGNREARNLGLPSGKIMSVSRNGNLAILIGAGNALTQEFWLRFV